MNVLNIGKEFSEDPAGRHYDDGPASGEHFRENYLVVRLQELGENELLRIIIDDGVEAYGSSFLSEAFGGVIKFGYLTKDELLGKISIEYTDEDFSFYENRIKKYIEEANYNSVVYEPTVDGDNTIE